MGKQSDINAAIYSTKQAIEAIKRDDTLTEFGKVVLVEHQKRMAFLKCKLIASRIEDSKFERGCK